MQIPWKHIQLGKNGRRTSNRKTRKLKSKIDKFRVMKQCRIREFASFVGTLSSCCSTLKYGRVYIRSFGRERFLALERNNDNFEAMMLSPELKEDFDWWNEHQATR